MIGVKEKKKLAGEYLDIGKKLYELEDFRDAIRNLQKAIHILEGINDYENYVEALATLGVVHSTVGSEELAVDNYLRALSIANANNFGFQIARVYNNIGSRFQELHEHEKAIDYFERANEAIHDRSAKKDPRYQMLLEVININMAKSYCAVRDLKKALEYLADARKSVGDNKENNFYIPLLIVECQVALAKGNTEYVKKHIDEVIEGVIHNKSASEFVQNITDVCEILEAINDEQHYKWVVLAFESFTGMHDSPYFNMVNAHFWANYYKYIGDIPHYQEMCVKHLNAYDKQQIQNQKNRSAAIDMRIELQGKDYHRFFEKYLANMRDEEEIENGFRDAGDRDEWLLNLQQRTQYMGELYVDNENLIDRYIAPVLSDEIEMDDELASELLKGIWSIYEMGKTEFRIGVELALKLEPYFEKKKYYEEHIRTLLIIIAAYTSLNEEVYYTKCLTYFEKLNNYKSYFAETKDKETKELLCLAFLENDIFMAGNKDFSIGQVVDAIEANLKFYEDAKIPKSLGLTEERATYYRNKYIQDMVSSSLVFCSEVDPENTDYARAYEIVRGVYDDIFEKTGNEYRVDDRLYGAHARLLYLMGKIPKEECYELYKNYYSYYVLEGKTAGDELLLLQDQREFHLRMYYVPEMLSLADESDFQFCFEMVQDYVEYIKKISKMEFENVVGRTICKSLSKVMKYIEDTTDAIDIIMSVIVERDLNLSIHSHMVAEISRLIVEMIYRQDAKLFIGNLGIDDEETAMELWPEVVEFVENAAYIHDIGKIDVSNITKKQTRKLSDLEYENVKKHPVFGALIMRDAESVKPYLPIVMGHHKGFDDNSGYPNSYKYMDNPNPLLVNIIQMADSLDAATDRISRAYSMAKTSEDVLREFEEGKGSRYNPVLVDMMLNDEKFKEELAELTTDGRKDICFDIFNSYLLQEE